MQFRKLMPVAILALLSAAAIGSAVSDPVSGKYEGVAKSQNMGDIPITVELKNDNGKISGNINGPQGSLVITDGSYADGKLKLKFDAGGNEGSVSASLKDGIITGEWGLAGQVMGTLELKTVGAGAPKVASSPDSPDPISGEWAAEADAQGTPIPFTLTLKVEGDQVTGESSSAQGTIQISKGSWAADKLSITLETPNGPIVLTAAVVEGKLVGEYDYASQFQGKWGATRK